MPAVTLKTISDRVGIHTSLISRVLRGDPKARISQENREEILRVAEEMGYRANHSARALRTKRTRVLAFTVPDIANPFYAVLFRAIEEVALARDYTLALYNTDESQERFGSLVDRLADGRTDGWLVASAKAEDEALETLRKLGAPFVVVNRRTNSSTGPWVGPDDAQTGRVAAEHLIKLGHKRIAYVSADLGVATMRKRFDGFEQKAREMGVTFDPRYLVSGSMDIRTVRAEVSKMFEDPDKAPTAVFVSNSRDMQPTLAALREHNLHVPSDVSILGYDPFHEALVSAIVPPVKMIGQLSANRLIDILEGIHSIDEPLHMELPVQLVDHGTTARVP